MIFLLFVVIGICFRVCCNNIVFVPPTLVICHVIYLFHILHSFLKRFWFIVSHSNAGGLVGCLFYVCWGFTKNIIAVYCSFIVWIIWFDAKRILMPHIRVANKVPDSQKWFINLFCTELTTLVKCLFIVIGLWCTTLLKLKLYVAWLVYVPVASGGFWRGGRVFIYFLNISFIFWFVFFFFSFLFHLISVLLDASAGISF